MKGSISEKYYNLLEKSANKSAVLVAFLREFYPVDDKLYGFIGKLVQLYGEIIVFESVLITVMSDIDPLNFKSYLARVCKNLFLERTLQNISTDLTKIANNNLVRLYRSDDEQTKTERSNLGKRICRISK
jgi:hypothetical protein